MAHGGGRSWSVSVRTRMVLIVAAVMLLTTAVLATAGGWWSMRSLREHERVEIEQSADQVERALERDAEALGNLVRDWAHWDDTYDFVATGSLDYVDSNLSAETLAGLDLDAFAIVTSDGTLRWGGGRRPAGGQLEAAPPELVEAMAPGGALFVGRQGSEPLAGLVRLGGELVLVSSAAVTDSSGTAPATGVLAMARHVDDAEVAALADRLRLDLRLEPPASPHGITSEGTTITLRRVVPGLTGAPVASMVVSDTMAAVAAGRSSLAALVGAVVVGLLLSGVAMAAFQDRHIGRRLRRLQEDAARIAAASQPSGRVGDGGTDEIGRLADVLNGMLGSLERSRQEVELRNSELLAANAAKDDFVSTVSHELRTPLTVIRAVHETMLAHAERLSPEDRHDLLVRADRNSHRLERLVSDLLVLSRLTDGRVDPQPERLHVAGTVEDALSDSRVEDVQVEVADDAEALADRDHVRRMLLNLLENAAKYGRPPVVVRSRRTAGGVRLEVEDHGDGVPGAFVPELFGRFTQADGGDRRSSSGTGLGLAIVDSLATANGGRVSYETGTSGGARFVIELPEAGASPELRRAALPPAHGATP